MQAICLSRLIKLNKLVDILFARHILIPRIILMVVNYYFQIRTTVMKVDRLVLPRPSGFVLPLLLATKHFVINIIGLTEQTI